jgi:hypothetical protein
VGSIGGSSSGGQFPGIVVGSALILQLHSLEYIAAATAGGGGLISCVT